MLNQPPVAYFALRSYLPQDHPHKAREIGSKPHPDEFIATMVAVFREVRRVLREDGFVWINLGDSFGGSWGNYSGERRGEASQRPIATGSLIDHRAYAGTEAKRPATSNQQSGQQLLIPHRVALALQADGWILRDTVVWSKRSAMPSSQNGTRWTRCRVKVRDIAGRDGTRKSDEETNGRNLQAVNDESARRSEGTSFCNNPAKRGTADSQWADCPGCPKCEATGGYILRRGQARTTTSHEYLFLFSKTNRYFMDMENWREPSKSNHASGNKQRKPNHQPTAAGAHNARSVPWELSAKRIPRSVLTLSSEPSRFKHYATFPSALVKFCLAPLSKRGCCPTCGAQWAPVVETVTPPQQVYGDRDRECFPGRTGNGVQKRASEVPAETKVTGYRPTCTCPAHEPTGCTVLDPFSGTGTTGQTAIFLGHRYIGIDLNEKYLEYAREWIFKTPRWHIRATERAAKRSPKPQAAQLALF